MKLLSYTAGAEVEVYLDRDGLRGGWFPATVVSTIKQPGGKEAYMVQFKSQIESVPSKLAVDHHQVRPARPSFANKGFELLDKVDAFCDGGWWSGVITGVLAEGRYTIFVKSTKKDKELSDKELRVHMEYINGKWLRPSQGAAKSQVGSIEGHTAVKRKRGRPPKSTVESLRVVVTDAAKKALDNRCIMKTGPELVVGLECNVEKRDSPVISGDQLLKDEPVKVMQPQGQIENKEQEGSEASVVKRKRGRPPKFQAGSPKTPAGKEQFDQDNKNCSQGIEVSTPYVAAEPAGTNDTVPSATQKNRVKFMSVSSRSRNVRSRGRNTGKNGLRWNIATGFRSSTQNFKDASKVMVAEVPANGSTKGADVVTARTYSNASDDDRPLSAWFEGAHSPHSAMDETRVIPGGLGHHCEEGRERPDSLKQESHVQSKQEDKADQAGVADDDIKQNEDAREREDETAIQSEVTIPVDNLETLDSRDGLPFEKTSEIWKMIESMEVFQQIPQKPHFHPLYESKEECREGIAIGNMVTFASLVENISKFRLEDPRTVLDSSMEALVDLEKVGFNVIPVRDRLQALISLKHRHEKDQNTFIEFGTQITERNNEKSKIDEEIEELDGQIKELQEKRALAVSLHEVKNSEIAILQSSVDALKGFVEDAGSEFQRVASAPW